MARLPVRHPGRSRSRCRQAPAEARPGAGRDEARCWSRRGQVLVETRPSAGRGETKCWSRRGQVLVEARLSAGPTAPKGGCFCLGAVFKKKDLFQRCLRLDRGAPSTVTGERLCWAGRTCREGDTFRPVSNVQKNRHSSKNRACASPNSRHNHTQGKQRCAPQGCQEAARSRKL